MEEQKRKRSASELEREFTVNEIVNICADYCGIVASRNASDQSALNRALEYKEGKDGLYRWLEKNYPCIKTTAGVGPTQDSDDSDEAPVMGPAVPTGFGEEDWMKKRGLLYGADDPNSWVKKPTVAQESKESAVENAQKKVSGKSLAAERNIDSDEEARKLFRQHADKLMGILNSGLSDIENAQKEASEESAVAERNSDGEEEAHRLFREYAAKQKFDGKLGW